MPLKVVQSYDNVVMKLCVTTSSKPPGLMSDILRLIWK